MITDTIQLALREHGIDGWLFFDHHYRDPLSYRILGLPGDRHVTRRWYYLIPAHGEPRALMHRIEPMSLKGLPGSTVLYAGWQEQAAKLRTLLAGCGRVAMQYSPRCAIPYVANVDAGTVELVRECGVEVVSSADLVQSFEACLSAVAIESHLEAGRRVDDIRRSAFELIRDRLRSNTSVTEYEVKRFILDRFRSNGLTTAHGPDVAVNANASNPHYDPKEGESSPIRPGDFVLIDMWAKLDRPGAIYYDITWSGFCGEKIPEEIHTVFEIVKGARDAAVRAVQEAFGANRTIRGFEVDDAARKVVREMGFGDYFFHRTGHSIGEEIHGNGVNMDNLESHDERRILPMSCFSIEPGIYLEKFGIRSELNMIVDANGARVSGEIQQELLKVA